MDYSFNTSVAIQHTERGAIFLHHVAFWTQKNCANEKHYYEGHYWTYNSVKAFNELFPFWTPKIMRSVIDKLVETGAILKGHYSPDKRDKTSWYAINDEILKTLNLGYIVEKLTARRENSDLPIRANADAQEGSMHLPQEATPFAQEGNCSGHDGQMIIGTDIKQTDKKPFKKTERGQKEKFLPPTLNEVILFFQKGNIKASAENFFNHWESVGWKKSRGQQIFNWEALVPKWVENEIQFTPAPAQSKTGANPSPKMKQQREILFENFKKKTRAFVEQLQTDASALETARIKFNQECNQPFEFSSQAVYSEINAYQIWLTNAPQLISEVDLTEITLNQFKRNFFNWFKIQKHGSYLFSETPNKAHRPPALQKI
jgi:hypothetical protein